MWEPCRRYAAPGTCRLVPGLAPRANPIAAATRLVAVLVTAAALAAVSFAAPSGSPAVRKQQARTQFETAERMREALNGRPESERTRKDYQKLADAYRKVYYVSPASSKADESIMAVAEILAEMGHQFAPDDKDLHAAIGQYEFLRREYPGSKYRMEALFTIGQIYKEDLGDDAAAKATFAEFLKKYPHNQLAPKAQEALAELSQPKAKKKIEVAAKATAGPPMDADTPTAKAGEATRVTGIRYWSTADYTRVAIDLDAEVKYEAGRVPDPDRIFFDLPDTRLVSTLVGKSFDVQDGFLKKIRVAQYQQGSTRVVLEVDNVAEYSAFLLPNPYRLIVDIHGKDSRAESQAAAPTVTSTTEATGPKHAATAAAAPLKPELKAEAHGSTAASVPKSPPASKPDVAATKVGGETTAATTTTAFKGASGELVSASAPAPKVAEVKTSVSKPGPAVTAQPAADDDQTTKPTVKHAAAVTQTGAAAPETTAKKSGSKKSAKNASADVTPVHVASPTSEGDRSLIRALGLKIGTIVIDAGHGGHDTGTIGPNGLLEKDLVLDVALRLGKLLESRLGAQVIYTRDDDTFIPLETRTAIANEHRADMFISVHANSSRDESARGVETYYLNFTTNSDALEVAARENAVSEQSVYQLQDLVKKITLKDKIEESKELAGDVQTSLYAGLSPKNPTLRNRGVKKAPFVVLIGANMPSILAEISFVSNPTDEKKLETPDYRQKIAESLYRGIAKYADGLSGVKVASKLDKESGK
jgi:N-acetylmuramoyl-L-alanine amidase